jgi:hypothetical protein
VAGVAIVTVAAGLAACGSSSVPHHRITLVPNAQIAEAAWDWTSACRVGPRTSTGCADAGPVLGPSQLAGNAWNLGGSTATGGSVRMSVDRAGGLDLSSDLTAAPPCTDSTCIAPQANTWVRGYPSVLYGVDQCNATTSPPQAAELRLPIKVRTIPSDLIGRTTYAVQAPSVTYDVAYDLWLNPSDTTTPCRTDGTLEVMVWTDYDAASLLPDSLRMGTATIPFAVDGHVDEGRDAWIAYATNISGGGRTAPWGGTVWLVLDRSHTVTSGSIAVDLSAALAAAGRVVQDHFGWSSFADTYWLDTIAFGMEFGPSGGDPYSAGPTPFSMDLPVYCLDVGTTVAAADC